MKAEEAKKLADQALDNLNAALAAGKSDALIAYLAAMGRFHDYSFGNVMLIVMQRPDATHVAGFNTWKTLGRFVKKGEKGIVIIAPMLIKPKDNAAASAEKDRTILRFKAVYVFDVSQTDGEPLPEFARVGGNPNGHADPAQGPCPRAGHHARIRRDALRCEGSFARRTNRASLGALASGGVFGPHARTRPRDAS
jgi:hypothetical protein